MKERIQFTPQASEDLDAIWWVIAENNRDAADRVEKEILATCHRLAKAPRDGNQATGHHAVASAVLDGYEIPQLCNYRPETVPLQVVAVLHGKRDLKEVMEDRI